MSNVISFKDFINKKNEQNNGSTNNVVVRETYLDLFSRLTVNFIDNPKFKNTAITQQDFTKHFEQMLGLPVFSRFDPINSNEIKNRKDTVMALWNEIDFSLSEVIKVSSVEFDNLRSAFINVFSGMHLSEDRKNKFALTNKIKELRNDPLYNSPSLMNSVNALPKNKIVLEVIKTQNFEEYRDLCIKITNQSLDNNEPPPFMALFNALNTESALGNIKWFNENDFIKTLNKQDTTNEPALKSIYTLAPKLNLQLVTEIFQALASHINNENLIENRNNMINIFSGMSQVKNNKKVLK